MSVVSSLRFTALLGVWLLLLVGSGEAASPRLEIKNLRQPVTAGSPTTYLDLLKLVHPDLEATGAHSAGAEKGQSAAVRHIDNDYAEKPLTGNLKFSLASAWPLKAQNRPLLLLRLDVTGEEGEEGGDQARYELLALVQTGQTPKLLDLMDIRQSGNQFNGFWTDNPLLDLTPATQACMIYHEHFNSQQSYLTIRLLFVRNQRLEEILSVSPFSEKAQCSTFSTNAVFWTMPDKGREYPRVVAKLTLKMAPDPADCQPRQRGFTRSYLGVWQWDSKQKYHQVSGNLEKLYKFYDKYY